MNKKTIITALLALVALTGQSQTVKGLPERVLNHQMDMTAPLPEPSFEMDTTTVRVHVLGWDATKPTKMVLLQAFSFFPYAAENHTEFINNDGVATIRFQQRGTSRANVSVDERVSSFFYLWPGETADVYVDFNKIEPDSDDYEPKNYGFGQKDTLRAEQVQRKVISKKHDADWQPTVWFEGRYADLNTAMYRYGGYGWDRDYEFELATNWSYANAYAEDMLAWRNHLKQLVESDERLPLCVKQLYTLNIDVEATEFLIRNAQIHDGLAALADGDPSLFSKYRAERPLSTAQIAQFREVGVNTNYRAYFSGMGIGNRMGLKYWEAVGGDNPCDYLHDMCIAYEYPRHIALYGKLPDGAMKDIRMPYFHQLIRQLEAAEEGLDHEVYSDVLEDLKQRYKGKVVLIDFWATWCHGCIVAMNGMEPMKDTKLNHPDLAFVYITDRTSPADRWQEFRNRIRGEHLRVNDAQDDALKRRFHIAVLPTYILMDRQGRCRELNHNHVVDEVLKELAK